MVNKNLQKIANTLILNQHNINSLGLLDGKLGIAIFLFHYAQLAQNYRYRDYAEQILDSVIDHIENKNFQYGFKEGICGIAWGIDYLNRNLFVEGEVNDVLEDIDNLILSNIDADKQVQLLLDSSLFDLGLYFSMRINNPHYNKEDKTVKNILTAVKTILSTDSSLNMSLLNSISYTVSQISYFFEINTSELDYLTKIITTNILRSIDEGCYSTSDLLICNALSPKKYRDVSSSSLQAGEIDIDTYIACTWQKLLYSFEKPIYYFKAFKINEEIDKLIMNLLLKDLTMEKGLTGLGIGLILNEK